MNTKIIGIVGGVIILGVIVWLAIGRAPAQPASNEPPGVPIVKDAQSTSGPTSLKSLLALGFPQTCEFTRNDKGEETSGIIYTDGKQMRGDFDTIGEGKTIRSHMIVDNETIYAWTEGDNVGIKMELNATPDGDRSTQGVDVDEQLDYRCRTWPTDSSLFRLPDDVEFTDFRAMLPSVITPESNSQLPAVSDDESATDDKEQQCGVCDSLAEPARSQCRTALGCL